MAAPFPKYSRKDPDMKFIRNALMALLLTPLAAMAQSLPSPSYKNLTVTGALSTPTPKIVSDGVAGNLYPQFGNAINTTATTTNGSPTVVVTSAAGIVVGQQAFASFFPTGSLVSAVSGTTVTLSKNSTVTNASPVAVRFGNDRWSPSASVLTNTLGAKSLLLGGAALGNWSWLNQWTPGSDYAELAPLFVTSPSNSGPVAAIFAVRSSDGNNSFATAETHIIQTIIDQIKTNPSSWGVYNEADLVSSPAVGYHMNEESSIYSEWPYVATDPFSYNQLGASRNLRLDCGKGVGTGSPQPCSAALEIIQNGATYGKGIVFGQGAVAAGGDGTRPAIVMAPNYALHWFTANNTDGWAITSTKTSGTARALTLGDSALTLSVGTDLGSGGHIYSGTSAPTLSACGTSPTLNAGASDAHGTITEGTIATGCTVTFLKTYANPPACVISSPNAAVFTSYTTSTTSLTIVNASASGSKYSYICMGG